MSEASEELTEVPNGAEAAQRAPLEAAPEAAHDEASEAAHDAAPEADGSGALTKDVVLETLKDVIDPELGINIVDLGLVYEVSIEGDTVRIEYTLTTMGCPIGPLIEQQMQGLLARVPGVENVDAEMVLRPPWSPEMMSEEAKAALGYF